VNSDVPESKRNQNDKNGPSSCGAGRLKNIKQT